MKKMKFSSSVTPELNGFFLVQYLVHRFTYLQETEWRRQLERGRLAINGRTSRADAQVWAGDIISFAPDMAEFPEPAADLNVQVVYEDDWIIVVNKTGNLLVHHQGSSVTNNLMFHLRHGRQSPYPDAGLVHRLDRETSGVIMVARHGDYVARLQDLFVRQAVIKTYLAVVAGIPQPAEGLIDAPIGRDPDSVIRYRYSAGERAVKAKHALTRYQTLGTRGDVSLLRVYPETGRTHQIRVHLAHAGHPILHDKLYGRSDAEFIHWRDRPAQERSSSMLVRQALHAESLQLVHPWTGEQMRFYAAMPEDMGPWRCV